MKFYHALRRKRSMKRHPSSQSKKPDTWYIGPIREATQLNATTPGVKAIYD